MRDIRYTLNGLAIGSAMISGACGIDDRGLDAEVADLASTEQAVYSGWTAYTSDEYPPLSCDGASLITAVQCTGRYCDNIRAYCEPSSGVRGGSTWTSYFSEE